MGGRVSHIALQHVIVRMLYDPDLVARVYDDPHTATRDCDLTDDERAWLVRSDRRAWSVDPYRRARSLTGLFEQFPVTCARLVRALGRDAASERLDIYFSSATFHRDLQHGSVLAISFGHWLASGEAMRGVDVETVLAEHPIEHAIVRARHAYESRPRAVDADRETIVWAPGIDVAIAREGAVQSFAAALGALRAYAGGLAEAVLDRNVDLVPPPADSAVDVGVLVLGHTGDVGLETLSAELATILEACRRPIRFDDLCAHASKVGATRDDVRGIVRSFAEDGVLRA